MAQSQALSPQRERQLVEQVQAGDRAALGELLGAYHRRVYHICLRMVGHAEDAADLAQETLLRAVRHVETFQHGSRFSTWLIRIAMNLCISHLRKGRVRAGISLEVAVRPGPGPQTPLRDAIACGREPPPHIRVETDEQIERLHAALDALDPILRGVLLLRDLQGMDYEQVAQAMSIPVGTVKSRLFRARLALRKAMETP
jgi:RNA polymerase sigma-70 factor, ECF subfamily